jgi:hypothetical protein
MPRGILLLALAAALPSAARGGLVINEALPSPHADWSQNGIPGELSDEWVEIANVGTEPLSLDGHFLASPASPGVPRAGLAGTLEPGERLLVTGEAALDWQVEHGGVAGGLNLGDSGDEVALVHATAAGLECVDALSWGTPGADVSVGRLPDGTGPLQPFDALAPCGKGPQPTPGGPNGGLASPKILEVTCEPRELTSADAMTVRAVAADADGIAGAALVLRVDGGPVQTFAMSLGEGTASRGTWSCVLPPQAAGVTLRWRVRVSDGALLAETNDVVVRVEESAVAGVWLNEILADPPPDPEGDANGDGVRNSADDEFVEVINRGSAAVDISAWTLADSTGVRHVFPDGLVLASGQLYVVFGGGTPTGIPSASAVASTGGLSLNNTADQVRLLDGAGVSKDAHSYGAEANADQSLIRLPDGDGAWTRPQDAGFAWRFSPGALNSAPSPVEASSWARIKALYQQ